MILNIISLHGKIMVFFHMPFCDLMKETKGSQLNRKMISLPNHLVKLKARIAKVIIFTASTNYFINVLEIMFH